MLTKEEIEEVFQSVANDDPEVHLRFAAAVIAAHTAKVLEDVEPFMFEEYPYNSHAMGCGLEDRDITDRYEAMAYGWDRAMERAAEAIPDDLYPAHTVAALKSERDALTTALAACRDSFPAPSPGSASENAWAAAIADPGSVPAYVAARVAELEKDAGRYRWLRDGEVSADYPYPVMRTGGIGLGDRTIWAEELDDAIDVALAAKGQA